MVGVRRGQHTCLLGTALGSSGSFLGFARTVTVELALQFERMAKHKSGLGVKACEASLYLSN